MRIKLAWMLGLLAAANGVFMLAAAARMFPTLKYALGYGKSCSLIRVSDTDTEVSRKAA
jgi:hypothetical protein